MIESKRGKEKSRLPKNKNKRENFKQRIRISVYSIFSINLTMKQPFLIASIVFALFLHTHHNQGVLVDAFALSQRSTLRFDSVVRIPTRIFEKDDENGSCDVGGLRNVCERDGAKKIPSRRDMLQNIMLSAASLPVNAAIAVTDSSSVSVVNVPKYDSDVSWPLGKVAFSLLPLAGTSSRRATVMETIVPGEIWTFDQIQGVVNVNVPVRMTVVKLSPEAGGGLFVYNPLAPTPQLMKMMHELEVMHGPVRHIVLGTVALEHKATFGPFAQNYPDAEVWIQPGQWSFPLTIPIELSGVIQRGQRLHEIPNSKDGRVSKGYQYYNKRPEWAVDFEYETLGPLKFKSVGAFSETAFFHKPTRTLLVTDCVIEVTETPPQIIQEDPRAMLFHARDSIDEIVTDTPETRAKGWRRMVQFGLVFFPSQIDVVSFGGAIGQASKIDSRMKPLGEDAVPFSLYPWTWRGDSVRIMLEELLFHILKSILKPCF